MVLERNGARKWKKLVCEIEGILPTKPTDAIWFKKIAGSVYF